MIRSFLYGLRRRNISTAVNNVLRNVGLRTINRPGAFRVRVPRLSRILKSAQLYLPPGLEQVVNYVSEQVGKPIIITPGSVYSVTELPEAIYISAKQPISPQALLHELGHVLSRQYTTRILPPGFATFLGLGISRIMRGSSQPFWHALAELAFPVASLVEAANIPYLIKEYKAQQAARRLFSEVPHPAVHALKQIFPISLLFR